MSGKPVPLLPAWLWLGFPLALLGFVLVVVFFFPSKIQLLINAEGGLVELGTPAVLLPAVVYGLMCIRHIQRLPAKWLFAWLMLVTAASFYFAGEELSWGQQLLHWQTPEAIDRLNDQHETNIHNMSSWFDQKPRILLELWIIIGGIFVPLANKFRHRVYADNDWRYWFWPHFVCLPTAVIAFFIKFPERYRDMGGVLPYKIGIRYSELQELFFAVFLLLFLLASYRKLSRTDLF